MHTLSDFLTSSFSAFPFNLFILFSSLTSITQNMYWNCCLEYAWMLLCHFVAPTLDLYVTSVFITKIDEWSSCRWCFDVELVYLCKYFQIPIIEISVNWSEIPGSKVSPLSILNILWELALMSMGYRTGIWSIRTRAC